LNRQMPRSLASCQSSIVRYLERLANDYGRRGPAQRLAADRMRALDNARIENIFQSGLHEYIQAFLGENHRLGQAIHEQYLS
ncbi:MAG: alpha-E domain-containing protein, partial [Brevundimonas sp.]|nr:alpha-E domain-containing protein [Brevundimonas sp.]